MTKMFNLNIMNHPNLTSNLQKVEVEKQVIITRQQSDESRTIDKMCIDITKKKKRFLNFEEKSMRNMTEFYVWIIILLPLKEKTSGSINRKL